MTKLREKLRLILLMKCAEASQLASESLERRLAWYETVGMKGHQLFCWSCRQFRRQILFLHQSLQRAKHAEKEELEHGPVLDVRVKERLKQLED